MLRESLLYEIHSCAEAPRAAKLPAFREAALVTHRGLSGPAILQGRLAVRPGEDAAGLSARVQRLEHIIYPRAVGWLAAGRLAWQNGAARLDGKPLREPVIEEAA